MKKNGILMDIGFSCYPFPISPIHIQMICPFHLSPGMQKDLGGHWCETWRSALQPRLPHQRGRGSRLGFGGVVVVVECRGFWALRMVVLCGFNTCGTCQRYPKTSKKWWCSDGFEMALRGCQRFEQIGICTAKLDMEPRVSSVSYPRGRNSFYHHFFGGCTYKRCLISYSPH